MKMNKRTKEKMRKQREKNIKEYFENNTSDIVVLSKSVKSKKGNNNQTPYWYEDIVSKGNDESGYYYLTINPVSEKGHLVKIAYQGGIQKHIMNPNAVKNRKKMVEELIRESYRNICFCYPNKSIVLREDGVIFLK